ncbi:hypothetical protein LCGC14_3093130 [marine sediment metagenome]|uniref:Uncharacterized protein n=1 Tax=marine sediment metagenome TaxID=412755 RepID=A0A0F8YHD2_9ZZZZ
MKTEDARKVFILFLILGMMIGVIGGIIIGMIMQQMIFTAAAVEIGESLEGTIENVEIDLNETQIIERYTDFMEEVIIPELKEYAEENK